MKILFIIKLFGILNFVNAGLLHFRPLTAKEVYNVLRVAKREDAVPEGRVITQGIAAVSGFAAGIFTGIGVPLVLNIDLANVTGITALLYGRRGTSSNTKLQPQEICFNSRAANDYERSDSAISFQPTFKEKQLRIREARARRVSVTENNDNDENDDYNEKDSFLNTHNARQLNTPTTSDETETDTPTTLDDNTNTGLADDDINDIGAPPQNRKRGAVNCVVIQKSLQ